MIVDRDNYFLLAYRHPVLVRWYRLQIALVWRLGMRNVRSFRVRGGLVIGVIEILRDDRGRAYSFDGRTPALQAHGLIS